MPHIIWEENKNQKMVWEHTGSIDFCQAQFQQAISIEIELS